MYCIKCGGKIDDNNNFCIKCGTKIKGNIKTKNQNKETAMLIPEKEAIKDFEGMNQTKKTKKLKTIREKKKTKKIVITWSIIISLGLIAGSIYYISLSKLVETSAGYVKYIDKMQIEAGIELIIEIEERIGRIDVNDKDYITEAEEILIEHRGALEVTINDINGLKTKNEEVNTINEMLIQWCNKKYLINEYSKELLEMTKDLESIEADGALEEAYSNIVEKTLVVNTLEQEAQHLLGNWNIAMQEQKIEYQ
ncbi:zinc ribbon domain-containing protein [Vallitalea okinawensis]|uniref:zinc ribbon domain-containing protein n=1 Tax=Vallitalea okinawensis TaxID=2078660 RepID=UPI000CFB3DD8|nr:zinc ribbon domain-containing protein [Vallitalea okinawensis]